MTTKSELATLAALAIVNGAPITRVESGKRAIPLTQWFHPNRRSEADAMDYELRKLSATFAGTRTYRGYK